MERFLFRIIIIIFCVKFTSLGRPKTKTLLEMCLEKVISPTSTVADLEKLNICQLHRVISCMDVKYDFLKTDEAKRLKWAITVTNEIDTFFETHDWQVNLTSAEMIMLKNIPQPPRKSRVKMILTCQHILIDLNSTDPDIQLLNSDIDSVDNMYLSRLTPYMRRNVFCNALVNAKIRRNKIPHELLPEFEKVREVNLFVNKDSWNECLQIFLNVVPRRRGNSWEDLDLVCVEATDTASEV